MELFIFARFHAREGKQDAVNAVLRDEARSSRAEPGCLAHNAYRSTRDPRLFFIHSRWIDDEALNRHVDMAHTLRFVEQVRPLIDHELDVTRTRSIE